jgi:DNA-binding response OmpR family regulator
LKTPCETPTRPTILIVDDDSEITAAFAHILKAQGYDVRTALSAEEGLAEAAVSRPDAVLLDLYMPIVDGLTFLRRLREDTHLQRTPVAIVTGVYWFDDSIYTQLRELGATVYFKPLWLDDLVRVTQVLLARNS